MKRRTSSRVRTLVDGVRYWMSVDLLHKLAFLSEFLLGGAPRVWFTIGSQTVGKCTNNAMTLGYLACCSMINAR